MLWKKVRAQYIIHAGAPPSHRLLPLRFCHLFKLIKVSYGLMSLSIQGYGFVALLNYNLQDNINKRTYRDGFIRSFRV